MPAYDYTCPNCGAYASIFKSMSKAERIEYCECAPFQPMQRVFNAPPAPRVHAGTPRFHQRKLGKHSA